MIGVSFRTYSQGYSPKEASFFRVGDSIRVDAEFSFGKILLDSTGNPKSADLLWLKNFLAQHDLVEVKIFVHTDVRGSYEKNLQRSQKRAESISKWLALEGINHNRFSIEGWGEAAPITKESIIDGYFRTNRALFDSLHRVNDRITVRITQVQQFVNCVYRPAEDPNLWKYYRQSSTVFRVNDRFRLDFIPANELPSVNVSSRSKYDGLVAFIRCNPSVVFAISVHKGECEDYFECRIETKEQAQRIVNVLITQFGLSENQFQAIGAGSEQPIIPDMVIDELENDPTEKKRLDGINTRVELVIAEIGAASK